MAPTLPALSEGAVFMSHDHTDPDRYVFSTRVLCPKCSSPDHRAVHGATIGDEDEVCQRRKCRACGWNFTLILEMPDSGNASGGAW